MVHIYLGVLAALLAFAVLATCVIVVLLLRRCGCFDRLAWCRRATCPCDGYLEPCVRGEVAEAILDYTPDPDLNRRLNTTGVEIC